MTKEKVDGKVAAVFKFLNKNKKWNSDFQLLEYRKAQCVYTDPWDKIKAQLHAAVNSQSQPNLDLLKNFWMDFDKRLRSRKSNSPTLNDLIESLRQVDLVSVKGQWDLLFQKLRGQDGWGPKTAALFVNKVIKIHRSLESCDLHFLNEPSSTFTTIGKRRDMVYLPVDSVITHIFDKHFDVDTGSSFGGINKYLSHYYSPDKMLVWDDLWFWGFLTQCSSKGGVSSGRRTEWNEAKAWSLQFLPKERIEEIRALATEFVQLLTS